MRISRAPSLMRSVSALVHGSSNVITFSKSHGDPSVTSSSSTPQVPVMVPAGSIDKASAPASCEASSTDASAGAPASRGTAASRPASPGAGASQARAASSESKASPERARGEPKAGPVMRAMMHDRAAPARARLERHGGPGYLRGREGSARRRRHGRGPLPPARARRGARRAVSELDREAPRMSLTDVFGVHDTDEETLLAEHDPLVTVRARPSKPADAPLPARERLEEASRALDPSARIERRSELGRGGMGV